MRVSALSKDIVLRAPELERATAVNKPERETVAMSTEQQDSRERAYSLVGRFMYHFARVEQKIDQAVIKLLDLSEDAAPIVTGGIELRGRSTLLGRLPTGKPAIQMKRILQQRPEQGFRHQR
jgi:hypothetical protein